MSRYDFAKRTYEENLQYISELPKKEKDRVMQWINRINEKSMADSSSSRLFDEKNQQLIGINVVRQQIQNLWKQVCLQCICIVRT